MECDELPTGWQATTYGDAMVEVEERAGERTDLPVLSLTKAHGPMLASERFSKALHSRDVSRYRVARRGLIVADPMLLWDGAIGVQRAVDAGLVSPDYRVYEPRNIVDPAFLARVVKSPAMLPYYQGGARGTNVRRNRIARSDFLRIPLLLPPLGEQRKIAAILSAVDEAIEATQAVIDQLQVVKKAMMAELLTRGIPGRHTRFKQTEIGEVPEGWALVPFEHLIAEGPTNGIYKPASKIGRGTLVAGMTAIERTTLNWRACRRAELDEDEVARYGMQAGDLLVTRVYARIDGIGRFIVVPHLPEPASYESNMMRIRVSREFALPEFVAAHMALPIIRRQIEQHATLGAQASINNHEVRRLPVRLAPRDEQREIVKILRAADERIATEEGALVVAQTLKSALTSVLLTGELRVTPDEASA